MNLIDGSLILDMEDSLNGFINIKTLQEKLGYSFKNVDFLCKALTHSSKSGKSGQISEFERVEFLGDKVLALCLSDILYATYPSEKEGKLSIRFSFLSSKYFMSGLFLRLGLDNIIGIPKDCRTIAVYTDYFESLIGVIFLESGYDVVKKIINNIWGDDFQESLQRDNKSLLQELLQSKSFGLPVYVLENVEGDENSLVFHMSVSCKFLELHGYGCGGSKKEAEQVAAKNLLEKLQNEQC